MARDRERTDLIVVHCTGTRAKQDTGVKTLNKQHMHDGAYSPRGLTKGHAVVRRSGNVELGRPFAEQGAHTLGWNDESIGIYLVGGGRKVRKGETEDFPGMVADDNFTVDQLFSLARLFVDLQEEFPGTLLVPAYALTTTASPAFDVWKWQNTVFGYDDEAAFAKYKRSREDANKRS